MSKRTDRHFPTIPVPQPEGTPCLVRAIYMFGPALLDIALWYFAANDYPELAGPALLGAPVAAFFGLAAARMR